MLKLSENTIFVTLFYLFLKNYRTAASKYLKASFLPLLSPNCVSLLQTVAKLLFVFQKAPSPFNSTKTKYMTIYPKMGKGQQKQTHVMIQRPSV